MAEQPPEKKAKTAMSHLLQTVGGDLVKADAATEFVGLLNDKQMTMLLAKIIERKQKESNDKDVVSFRNAKNYAMMQYLKIPSCGGEREASFVKTSNWINRAVEISCTTSDNQEKDKTDHTSAKRITKALMKKYPEAAKEAIKEVKKMPQENKMSGLKIAAMFKSAEITSIKKRRYVLRHLRHHFGSHAFDAGHYVQKIWDGHSDPQPEMITWIAKVNEDACSGPRKSDEEKEEERILEEERKLERKMEIQRQREDVMLRKAIEEERKLERKMEKQRQRADGMLHSHRDME